MQVDWQHGVGRQFRMTAAFLETGTPSEFRGGDPVGLPCDPRGLASQSLEARERPSQDKIAVCSPSALRHGEGAESRVGQDDGILRHPCEQPIDQRGFRDHWLARHHLFRGSKSGQVSRRILTAASNDLSGFKR